MTPEQLLQIEELFHAVREKSADERAALLARADPDLRREVESLLSQQPGNLLLDRPAATGDSPSYEETRTSMPAVGMRLGPYQLEGKLGAGGMGEVFRAVDTRLGRAVAVKITHERFSARFDREARAISSLNHPNICTLYDVGPNYLVMELVEGETLASRLTKGPLPADLALQYGSQILAALAEAHGGGVVHRDLKPANVMLTKTGVKVLDFGLAALEGAPTLTAEHMVMGTPAYMAPEQREGQPADARTDIYGFGLVLSEMMTGARGALKRKRLPSQRLERIVSRCLEEDPEHRWPSAAQLQRELAAVTPARRATTRAAVAAAAVLLVAAAVAYFYLRRTPALTETDTIVLGDFTNTTGDPVFDNTLRQGLAAQLQQSPFLSLVTDARIGKTLALMQQPPDARLTPEIAQGVCVRTEGAVVLDGSIASLGSQYILGLRARNCANGDVLADEQAQAARKEDVLGSLSHMVTQVRERLGESRVTIEKYSRPFQEATTASLDAWKAFTTANQVYMSSGRARAQPLFERAIAIDPDFAIAHARLGVYYSAEGESALSRQSTIKAYQLRHRASDAERFYIEMAYDRQVTGNMDREMETLEAWAQTYPRDSVPHGLLAAFATRSTGRYEQSIAAGERSMAVDPEGGSALSFNNKAHSELNLNRLDAAEATIRRAEERKFASDYFLVRYFIAFLRGDGEGIRQQAAIARASRSTEDLISHLEALRLAGSAQLQDARRTAAIAAAIAKQSRRLERAALFETATAVWEAFYGNAAAARQKVAAALSLGRGHDVDYAAAFALANSGDVSRSRALADGLARDYPEDTSVQFIYLPTLRALFALDAGDAPAAIQSLQASSRFDLAMGSIGFNGHFGKLYPIYVRGLAYLAAHQPAEAAAEFQRLIDHRSIVLVDPVDAMARLQLARALVLSGDIVKAKNAYDDLLTLWKDSDPKNPKVTEARAEYAKLR